MLTCSWSMLSIQVRGSRPLLFCKTGKSDMTSEHLKYGGPSRDDYEYQICPDFIVLICKYLSKSFYNDCMIV